MAEMLLATASPRNVSGAIYQILHLAREAHHYVKSSLNNP